MVLLNDHISLARSSNVKGYNFHFDCLFQVLTDLNKKQKIIVQNLFLKSYFNDEKKARENLIFRSECDTDFIVIKL